MARTLDQIIAELNTAYQPQIQNVQKQMSLIPQQTNANIEAAKAAQTQAYGDILSGARSRGTGVAFGGIPLGEQAKYASTVFAPAVLQAKAQGQQRALSLQDAINQIYEKRNTMGQSIYQTEQDRAFQAAEAAKSRAFQERQNALNRASQQPVDLWPYFQQAPQQSSVGKMSYSFSPAGGGEASVGVGAVQRVGSPSFSFTDNNNKPITAGRYAQLNNIDIRDLLAYMYDKGDKSVKDLYNSLYMAGNDQNKLNAIIKANTPNYAHILGGMR